MQRRDSRDRRDKVGTVKNSDNSLKKHYIREYSGAVIVRRRWHQRLRRRRCVWMVMTAAAAAVVATAAAVSASHGLAQWLQGSGDLSQGGGGKRS